MKAHEHDRADQTRARILRAAVHHFSQHGLAGARTDAIAESAGVNKALLYYYFKNKSGLYNAALEDAATTVMESALTALESGSSAGESLLRFALNHFDRVATQHEFQGLMHQEMVRFQRGESKALHQLAQSVFTPLFKSTQAVICEGIRTGELYPADSLQIMYATLGANVFYFLSAPMMRLAIPFEPLDSSALKNRRRVAIEFLGQALFRDRSHGAKLARRVLADAPEPILKSLPVGRKYS
jgi:TetR/AcrR family transcriptional regulator